MTAVCLDTRSAQVRVAVQAKKKLYMYEFASNSFKPMRELALADVLAAVVWHGASLFLAYGNAYELLDLHTLATTRLFTLAPGARPLMRVLDGELFLANDLIGMIVDFTGQPTRASLQFSESPLGVAFQFPYVVTLQANGLEVGSSFRRRCCCRSVAQRGVARADSQRRERGAGATAARAGQLALAARARRVCAALGRRRALCSARDARAATGARLAPRSSPAHERHPDQVSELLRVGRHADAVRLFEQVSNAHHPDYDARLRRVLERAGSVAWRQRHFAGRSSSMLLIVIVVG